MKKSILLTVISIMMLILLAGCAANKTELGAESGTAAPSTEHSDASTPPEPEQGPELSEALQKAADYRARQAEAEAALQSEMENGYSLEEPLVVVDPYGLSALTAVVGFETAEETCVSVVVKGRDAYTGLSHQFEEYATRHLVPVYGLYADEDNEVEITVTDRNGKTEAATVVIKTEALPDDISQVDVKTAVPEKMTAGLTFFDCPHVNGNYCLAIDANGDIRWYLGDKTFNGSVMLTHLCNGNFLVPSGDVIPDTYNNLTTVHEVTPLGKLVNEYQVYGIHHDIREKADGNLLFAASKEGAPSQNDYIVEIDRQTGEKVRDWDLMEIIPMTAYDTKPPYSGGLSNWLHNNAIWYIDEEDAFIISGRHQNMVMKFDADTGAIRWILSETVGEDNEQLRPYLLTPAADGEFEYPTSQHAAMQTPEGDLMLFDNRNMDEQKEDGSLDQEKLYSRAVRYAIDEETMTVRQVWQYGKERGTEIFSSFISDVDYLGPEHYLIDFGGMYKLEDGTSYDHVLTSKEEKNTAMKQSTVIEIADDEVIFEALLGGDANSNTYKAERKDIYQNARELLAEQ